MRRMSVIGAVIWGVLAGVCSAAPREGDGVPVVPEAWEYTLEIKPMLWAPALRGNIRLPGSGTIDVEDVGVDESRLAPAGQAEIRSGKWFARLRAFGFSIDTDGRAGTGFELDGESVSAGDRTDASVEFFGADLRIGYDLWEPVRDEARDVRLVIGLYGGARLFDVDTAISSGGASARGNETWLQPIVGARLGIDLPAGFGVEVTGDVGGFVSGDDESFSWDITAAFTWRWENRVGLEIGFRHLDSDLSSGSGSGEYEFDAALAGLYGAVVIRF